MTTTKSQILKRTRDLVTSGYIPESGLGCAKFGPGYVPMTCGPLDANCRSWDFFGAFYRAWADLGGGLPVDGVVPVTRDEFWAAYRFLDTLVPPLWVRPSDGKVLVEGDVDLWLHNEGKKDKTQQEVLDLLSRAILRAQRMEAAA